MSPGLGPENCGSTEKTDGGRGIRVGGGAEDGGIQQEMVLELRLEGPLQGGKVI